MYLCIEEKMMMILYDRERERENARILMTVIEYVFLHDVDCAVLTTVKLN